MSEKGCDSMVPILDILKWAGYSNPTEAYKKLSMDYIQHLIHEYYKLHPVT